jgi:CubicO group peptidase (beta-lactamase class C family)
MLVRWRAPLYAARFSIMLCSLLVAGTVAAAGLKTTKPERVGMSSERLARINEIMQRHVDEGRITGAVTAVARRGKVVHFEAHGYRDPNAKTPMTKDAIFRMASSSKPVTGVAILMLMEEGRVRLSDPVSKYIPEFKNMKVAVPKPGMTEQEARRANNGKPEVDLVPANREITIEDLMTHTSGLHSGGLGQLVHPVPRAPGDTLATYIPKLAAAPLDFQPGTRWSYSALAGIDTLARIVEIASGLTFDEFLRRRIFEPLGMRDTFFVVPEDKRARLLPLFRRNGDAWQEISTPAFLATRTYFSGAGGLYSTAHDYVRFEQMLVNGGALDGKRLLSPKTVQLMSMNHVGDLFRGLRGRDNGLGFGLTVYVTLDTANATRWRTAGSFGWAGAFGTITWSDPKEELIAVLMIQQSVEEVQNDFHTAVMQAIVESNL